jgi:nucleotide-binding universal stress UspA family protein
MSVAATPAAGAPDRRSDWTHDQRPDDLAEAILRELGLRFPARRDVGNLLATRTASRGPSAVVVGGSPQRRASAVVAAAVDDDGNPGQIIRFAAAEARRLSLPLRVVHVWTGGGTSAGVRLCRRDRVSDADLLLSAVLYDHLPADAADAAEREILHDSDPVPALVTLSSHAALLVVAARSTSGVGAAPLGGTVRELIGRTACPLAVLPSRFEPEEIAYPCTW